MLTSLSLIFLLGLLLSSMFNKLKLPGLLGMILTGIILGPSALNLLDPTIIDISADLRKVALVIILTRAGLALDIKDLKRAGRPAILMCFVPACFEITGIMILAPLLLHVTLLEAAIMGSVVAAVSPAVIVPRMLKLMESGYGKKHSVPQLLMAGSSVDDIFVIILFTSFTGLAKGQAVSLFEFLKIPVSILLGLAAGILFGLLLSKLFLFFHSHDSVKVILLISISFLLIAIEPADPSKQAINHIIPFSGLLAIMAMSATILKTNEALAKRLQGKFSQLWVSAEILLFVLVGAIVDLRLIASAGIVAVLIILGAMLFRMLGVTGCLLKTKLSKNERIFCMFSYLPKGTVQAAIAAIPLTMGLACGQIVLTVGVLSILICAPIGAVLIDRTYKRLLKSDK